MKKLVIVICIILLITSGCTNKSNETSSKLNEKIDSTESELNNTLKKLEEKDEKIENLNIEIAKKEVEIRNINTSKEAITNELEKLKNEFKSNSDRINLANIMLDYYKNNMYINEINHEYTTPTNKPYYDPDYDSDSMKKSELLNTEEFDLESFGTIQLDKSRVNKLSIDIPGSYSIHDPIFIDDNTIVFYIRQYSNKYKEAIFYKYEIKNKSLSVFYVDSDFNNSNAKVLNDGNIAFVGSSKILVFEKDSLRLLKSIIYPEEIHSDVSISNNGDKLAYRTDKGMCISSLDFKDTILLIKQAGNDSDGLDSVAPRNFKWSSDDKKIGYTVYGYEWTNGIGIINLDDYSNKYYKLDDYHFKNFFKDNKHILLEFGFELSEFRIINIENDTEKFFKTNKLLHSIAKINKSRMMIPIRYYEDNSLYIIDVENKSRIKIEIDRNIKIQDDLYVTDWNQSGNKVIMTINDLGKNEEIYIIDIN